MKPVRFCSIEAAARLGGIALLVALFAFGCSKHREAAKAADQEAYEAAAGLEQAGARIQALREFLDAFPESPRRPAAYRRLYEDLQAKDEKAAHELLATGLARETDPAVRAALLYKNYLHAKSFHPEKVHEAARRILDENPGDWGIYNAVAWDFVEEGENLDLAVALSTRGSEKAPDSLSKAYVLDTEGWALYKMNRFPEAVSALQEAAGLQKEPDQEVLEHLALAQAAAGKKEEALSLLTTLLGTQEDPELRREAEAIATEMGRPLDALREEIRRRRMDQAAMAPDFTLKDLDGRPMSLSDFRGKVVLLNFWHPT